MQRQLGALRRICFKEWLTIRLEDAQRKRSCKVLSSMNESQFSPGEFGSPLSYLQNTKHSELPAQEWTYGVNESRYAFSGGQFEP